MTKSEIIGDLIEKGLSFEEVVEQSGCKVGYVKGQYTKRGLKWDAKPEVQEEPEVEMKIGEEVIEGVTEEDIVEVAEEDIPEDAEIKEEPLEIVTKEEDPLAEFYKSCFEALDNINMGNIPYMTHARVKKYVDLAKQVLITKDLRGERLQALNARYNYIIPRPAGRSETVKVLALHRVMKQLFRAYYNN